MSFFWSAWDPYRPTLSPSPAHQRMMMTRTAGLWGFTSMQTHHGWPSGRFPGSTPCSSTGAHLVHGGLPFPSLCKCHKEIHPFCNMSIRKRQEKRHTPLPPGPWLSLPWVAGPYYVASSAHAIASQLTHGSPTASSVQMAEFRLISWGWEATQMVDA